MPDTEPSPGLPVEFLTALVVDARPDAPPARLALEQVRVMSDGDSRNTLILALLRGPLSGSAPEWMLQVAVDQDLQRTPEAGYTRDLELAGLALSHPCCTDTLLRDTLRRCSATQLAVLGRASCTDALADAVARELRDRSTDQQPFTPQLLCEPGPAQLVLREARLHGAVFTAAVDCLPSMPDLKLVKDSDDSDRWWEDYLATSKAWKAMWEQVLAIHTDRHRQLVEWADDTKADHVIREHLLATFPWLVEPALLDQIATDDLATFSRNVLITRLCRSLSHSAQRVDY